MPKRKTPEPELSSGGAGGGAGLDDVGRMRAASERRHAEGQARLEAMTQAERDDFFQASTARRQAAQTIRSRRSPEEWNCIATEYASASFGSFGGKLDRPVEIARLIEAAVHVCTTAEPDRAGYVKVTVRMSFTGSTHAFGIVWDNDRRQLKVVDQNNSNPFKVPPMGATATQQDKWQKGLYAAGAAYKNYKEFIDAVRVRLGGVAATLVFIPCPPSVLEDPEYAEAFVECEGAGSCNWYHEQWVRKGRVSL